MVLRVPVNLLLQSDKKLQLQTLYPVHCVQHSVGAQLHPELVIVDGATFIYKGSIPSVEQYSAFACTERSVYTVSHICISKKNRFSEDNTTEEKTVIAAWMIERRNLELNFNTKISTEIS